MKQGPGLGVHESSVCDAINMKYEIDLDGFRVESEARMDRYMQMELYFGSLKRVCSYEMIQK